MNTKLNFETIDMLSKGITQFAFRSGPVEEMHASNKLTQKDMEILNKYMTNRIAGLLQTIFNGDVAKALKVLTILRITFFRLRFCKTRYRKFLFIKMFRLNSINLQKNWFTIK